MISNYTSKQKLYFITYSTDHGNDTGIKTNNIVISIHPLEWLERQSKYRCNTALLFYQDVSDLPDELVKPFRSKYY